jgi:ferredoxin-nitrite reductase
LPCREQIATARGEEMAADSSFTDEQKQYLEGFIAAIANKRGMVMPNGAAIKPAAGSTNPYPADPMAIHYEAQDRTVAAGGKLVAEEVAKREKHPFDIWDEIAANAVAGRFPKGLDIFRHKFHGLFYVAPNQDAFMLRLRLPGGIILAHQARGLADVAERFGGGYVDITTRANLQVREIGAAHPLDVLEAIDELGLTSRGSGADNIRNLTGSPAAGIDAQELIDTRPLCRALYHCILNHRELYGLPRKFNIAFDGGGRLSVLEDTNDIGFAAVGVGPGKEIDGNPVAEGIYFRMMLGGLTGHQSFAADAGVLLTPDEVVPAAVAILKVFIANGDRTDRHKARLKYLIDRWGVAKIVNEAAAYPPFAWRHAGFEINEPRGPIDRYGHIGVHEQAQKGLCYIGIVAPVGRLSGDQLRGVAAIAERFGSGMLRLTVWQNLLISDIPRGDVAAATAAVEALGLGIKASAIRGGLIACTGNAGCKFALADTKRHGLALADYLDARVTLDTPLNIHLTGCPNSCAQHVVGDIGLLATKVDAGGDDEVEGYHVHIGGGSGAEQRLGREIFQSVPAEALPERIEEMLRAYLAHRRDSESFYAFVGRHGDAELTAIFAPVAVAA